MVVNLAPNRISSTICYSEPTMIHLRLQPEIEAQLAAEAAERGLAIDRYIETIVSHRTPDPVNPGSPEDAVAAIRRLRKGIRLNGIQVSDLISEGRKY
jgi:hypothetical protein